MSYNIIPTNKFKKEAARLIKKYPSLKKELEELSKNLSLNPRLGKSLGNNVYKIRLLIKSKSQGKRGGARVITYVITIDLEIYLLLIYDKSEYELLDDKLIRSIIASIQKP
jgi:hypothetical protein